MSGFETHFGEAMALLAAVVWALAVILFRKSGEAVYIPGDWLVQYSPDDRELIVVAVMNYIRIDWLDSVFQGKTKYILIGNVSEDGQMWQTTVYSFPEYEGFPVDPNDLPYTKEVDFVKVAGEI